MPLKRPTRKDVALRAGVAPSTVSLVLQDKGDELRIPHGTQERVREAARSLGYYRNWHIEAVMKGRSGVIGVYLRADQWASPEGFWPTMLWHLQGSIAAADLRILLHNALPDCSTEEAFARQAGGIVDGVLILNSGDDPIVARIMEANLPAVEIGDPYSPLPFVGTDGPMGIRLALDHLYERGFRRPAFLGHISNYEENMSAREETFLAHGKERFGYDLSGRTALMSDDQDVFSRIMAIDPTPDSVICASDEFAYSILRGCAKAGLRVPEDFGIVGFDALGGFGRMRELTSVATPLRLEIDLAVEKLLAVIEGRPFEHGTLLPVALKIGDTT